MEISIFVPNIKLNLQLNVSKWNTIYGNDSESSEKYVFFQVIVCRLFLCLLCF